jgi:HNH endonuclease
MACNMHELSTMKAKLFDERLPASFWDKVSPEPNSGCWLWMGAKIPTGYGKFRNGSRAMLAHRHAYLVMVGSIPDELVCDHMCHVRSCCNPSHIRIVTQQENVNNTSTAGVEAQRKAGAINGRNNARLTQAQVRDIRTLYAARTHTQAELGELFLCSKGHIHNIVSLKRRADVK